MRTRHETIKELERRLADETRRADEAERVIRAVVAAVGGKVTIPDRFLVDTPREIRWWDDVAAGAKVVEVR